MAFRYRRAAIPVSASYVHLHVHVAFRMDGSLVRFQRTGRTGDLKRDSLGCSRQAWIGAAGTIEHQGASKLNGNDLPRGRGAGK